MGRRKGACPAGFTLLEVVVAMAILGLGLVAVMELFSSGLRLAGMSEEYSKAVGYARAKLEEVAISENLIEGEEEGEINRQYRWRVGVKKVEVLASEKREIQPPVDLYQIEVSILWGSGVRERSATFEAYRIVKPKEEGQKS